MINTACPWTSHSTRIMKKGKDKVHIVHNCEHIWEYFNTFISHLQLTLMRLSCICLNRGEVIQSPHMPGQWTIKEQNVWKVFKVIMKCLWHVIRCYGIMLISNAFIIENRGLSRKFWFQKCERVNTAGVCVGLFFNFPPLSWITYPGCQLPQNSCYECFESQTSDS